MTNDEAKFILSAFRPSGGDADSPAFTGAVRMAGGDPLLGQWFARSRAHDAAVAAKLGQIMPPPGLREAILAGARVSAGPRSALMRLTWAAGLAAAAALAVVVATMKEPVRPGALAAPYAGFAINDTLTERHGGRGEPAAALVGMLQARGAPMPGADQIDFDRLRGTGCRTVSFAGHDVVEVCFARDGVTFHLYVLRHDGALGESLAGGPVFIAQAAGAAAVWSDKHLDFALVTGAGVETLRRLF